MRHSNETFDAVAELQEVRASRAEARLKRYRTSKLDKYSDKLIALHKAGASSGDIATWCKSKHRCNIHRSTVERYIKKLLLEQSDTQPVGDLQVTSE